MLTNTDLIKSFWNILMLSNEDSVSLSYIHVCSWIGNKEYCRHPTIFGKAYCEKHYDRMYLTMLPEMATYIIEKELKDDLHKLG